jgi:hypothetical protein
MDGRLNHNQDSPFSFPAARKLGRLHIHQQRDHHAGQGVPGRLPKAVGADVADDGPLFGNLRRWR